MNCHIVVEGAMGARIIRWLLADEFLHFGKKLRLHDADGKSGLFSKAETLLAVRKEPVAVIANSDSLDSQYVEGVMADYEWGLRRVASAENYKIFFFMPALESIFFQKENYLSDRLNQSIRELQRTRGLFQPAEMLQEIAREKNLAPSELMEMLLQGNADPLRSLPPIPEIIEFLHSVQRLHPATA